jgi:hypothetical protein
MALSPSGKRDKLVTIQSRPTADTVDGSGAPAEIFTDMPPCVWMSKKALAEGERFAENFASNQLAARVFTTWDMPYQSNMDPERVDVPKLRRLVHQGRVYDITSADLMARPDGHGIRLVTIAKSGPLA